MSPDEINQIIDMLQKKLGPISQTVWEAYVRQQYVIGVQQILLGVAFLIATGIGAYVIHVIWSVLKEYQDEFDAKKAANPTGYNGTRPDGDAEAAMTVLVGIVAVVLFLIGAWLISDGIGHLVNPTYGAIQGLLGR